MLMTQLLSRMMEKSFRIAGSQYFASGPLRACWIHLGVRAASWSGVKT